MLRMLIPLFLLGSSLYAQDDCRANAERAICIIEEYVPSPDPELGTPIQDLLKSTQDFPCSAKDPFYTQKFLEAYDLLPDVSQKIFCDVKQVVIYKKNFYANGLASVHFDLSKTEVFSRENGKTTYNAYLDGFVMSLNGDLFTESVNEEQYLNGYVQVLFSDHATLAASDPTFPHFVLSNPISELAATMIHETGHMISRANSIEETDWWKFSFQRLEFVDANGNRLDPDYSAKIDSRVRKLRMWPSNEPLLTASDYQEIPNYLKTNSLVSMYAGNNPEEDWAESYTFIFTSHARLMSGTTILWDANVQLATDPIFTAKINFVRSVISSPDLKFKASNHPPETFSVTTP